MNKMLLKEYSAGAIKLDPESDVSGDKPITVVGVVQRADAKNQNGRIYPYEILKKEVDRYIEECVKKGVAMGQLDHTDKAIIDLQNVSHLIENLWWGGDGNKDLMGKIKILKTPAGRIAEEIVKAGIPLGISSRAVGSVMRNEAQGADVVGDDLQIVCWDLVGTPSTHQAYLSMHENFDPLKALPRPARIQQTLKELLKK
jgi:hypothetical protein